MSQVLEAKKIESMADVELGHILVCSWGYDQTNIDYYKVIRKTAAMVELQAIGQKYVEATSSMSEYVMPDLENELVESKWVYEGSYNTAEELLKEGYKVAENQGEWHEKPRDWASRELIESAVKYEKKLISKHKAQFSNGQLYVRMNSYSWAHSWDGFRNFQSHWA